MSRARLHVFVEGRQLDAYVYGKLCARECAEPFGYRIIRADELPGAQSGGKTRLLDLFSVLRRSGNLREDFKGQRHAVLFFLDKDIDDIMRRCLRSPHLVYTRGYDLEGDIYRADDLPESLAATCSLDPSAVRAAMSTSDWRDRATDLWRAWVELCVASRLAGARGLANYGVASRVNIPMLAPADAVLVAQHEQYIVACCPLAAEEFSSVMVRARRLVKKAYDNGHSHSVFKGKWFGDVIEQFAVEQFGAPCARVAGFKERLVGHLAQSANYDAPWAARYRTPVAALVATTGRL